MGAYRPYSGPPLVTDAIRERFWSKVRTGDGCWEWIAGLDDKGYGLFKLDGRMWKSQRVSWLLHDADPGAAMVLHKCDNPKCVRPDHLFLGTHSENMADCARKGRLNVQNGLGGVHRAGHRGCFPRPR